MNRVISFLAIVLSSAALLAGALQARSSSASTPLRYEYAQLILDSTNTLTFAQAETTSVVNVPTGTPMGGRSSGGRSGSEYTLTSEAKHDPLMGALNFVAEDGWEAITETRSATSRVILLRRPL